MNTWIARLLQLTFDSFSMEPAVYESQMFSDLFCFAINQPQASVWMNSESSEAEIWTFCLRNLLYVKYNEPEQCRGNFLCSQGEIKWWCNANCPRREEKVRDISQTRKEELWRYKVSSLAINYLHKCIMYHIIYCCSAFLQSISEEPGAARVSSAILRTVTTQTGSPRLSASDNNDHKRLFSGPRLGNLRRLSAVRRTGRSVCVFLDACQRGQEADVGTWVTWYMENVSPSITCWNLLRRAKDRPRPSHSQGVNQSDSRSLFGWNNVEIDSLPAPAEWQKTEPNARS